MSHCRDLDPEERLLAGIVRLAIRDAQQERDQRLRADALCWLWTHAPTVASMAELPPIVPYSPHVKQHT